METWTDTETPIKAFVATFQALIAENPKVRNSLAGVNQLVWFDYTENGPNCSFHVDARSETVTAAPGKPDEDPDLTMKLPLDLAHQCWSNKANVILLITRGKIVVKGLATKLLKLMPLLKDIAAQYNKTLKEMGLEDKIIS